MVLPRVQMHVNYYKFELGPAKADATLGRYTLSLKFSTRKNPAQMATFLNAGPFSTAKGYWGLSGTAKDATMKKCKSKIASGLWEYGKYDFVSRLGSANTVTVVSIQFKTGHAPTRESHTTACLLDCPPARPPARLPAGLPARP